MYIGKGKRGCYVILIITLDKETRYKQLRSGVLDMYGQVHKAKSLAHSSQGSIAQCIDMSGAKKVSRCMAFNIFKLKGDGKDAFKRSFVKVQSRIIEFCVYM